MSAHTLGTRLKAERESRGLTLGRVSASTKIPISLLEGLERDDLSRWPKGLYRRAFFRSYVTALGLPAEPLAVEFARLFPDDALADATASEAPPRTPHRPETDRSFASGPQARLAPDGPWRSVAMTLLEVILVYALGALVAWTSGLAPLTATGAVALVYYPTVIAVSRRSRASTAAIAATAERAGHAPVNPPGRFDLAGTRLGDVYGGFRERCRPVAARIRATTTQVVAPAARRTGRHLTLGAHATRRVGWRMVRGTCLALMRTGIAAGRGLRRVGRESRRLNSRGVATVSHGFWRVVRAAAEYAALVATRQLNRTRT